MDPSCMQVQKKNYRSQKKQAAKELQSTLSDSSVVVLADWLKVRGTLKSWTKLWCVLKPGLLVLYKSEKQKVGSVPGRLTCGKHQYRFRKIYWECPMQSITGGIDSECNAGERSNDRCRVESVPKIAVTFLKERIGF